MNRILKRIAAYYESNGMINSNIPQAKSNDKFNDCMKSQYTLNSLVDNNDVSVLHHLKYDPCNIGLCGDTFIINNDKYILEWQVHGITRQSRLKAIDELNDYCINNKIYSNTTKYQTLHKILNNYIQEKYYVGVLLIFKNEQCDIINVPVYFNQNYSQQQLKNEGIQRIKQYKQKLLNE